MILEVQFVDDKEGGGRHSSISSLWKRSGYASLSPGTVKERATDRASLGEVSQHFFSRRFWPSKSRSDTIL